MIEPVMMRLVGGALIVGASSLAGFFFSKRGPMREQQLLEMKKALTVLKNDIRFRLTPFAEAAAMAAETAEGPVAQIFAECAENALQKNGSAASEIWEKAVYSGWDGSFFHAEDIKAFISMGKSLGMMDREMQCQSIDLLIGYIDKAVDSAREKSAKDSKMYRSLGFLGGLLIAVVLF